MVLGSDEVNQKYHHIARSPLFPPLSIVMCQNRTGKYHLLSDDLVPYILRSGCLALVAIANHTLTSHNTKPM